MTELTEKAIETDIETLIKNPLVQISLSQCDRSEKGGARIYNNRLHVILPESIEDWSNIVVQAIDLLGKVQQINEHNANHPDLYERVKHKLGMKYR